jgi:hypothetical protein
MNTEAMDETGGESGKGPPQSQILIELADDVKLFRTPASETFATIQVKGHEENWPISSQYFKLWLTKQYFRREGKAPASGAMSDAINTLKAKALFGGEEHDVFIRIGELEGIVYLDLCNENWEVIEIDSMGWRKTSAPPIKFRRARGMLHLPCPLKGGSVNDLRRFINVPEDRHFVLVIAWLLGALRPKGPFPLICLQGEQGSAKSTLARILRSLIDPSISPLRTTPKDARDLAIAANNGWIICFDNLSGLRDMLSDSLCRLATGGGFSTRGLYTDSDEIIFDAMRPCILNGIEEVARRNDLIDRAIVLPMPPMSSGNRKSEKTLLKKFEDVMPYILGALLDAISEALRNISTVKLESLPRMADFAEWVVAAEPALPWDEGDFIKAYEGNRAEAVEVSLDSDAVAAAIINLLNDEDKWEGTSTELLEKLEGYTKESILKSRSWPKDARTFSGRVDRAAPFLREVGISVEKDRSSTRRLIILEKSKEISVTPVTSVTPQSETQLGQGIQAVSSGADDDVNAKRMTEMAMPASPSNSLQGKLYDGNDGDDAKYEDSLETEEIDPW